MARLPVASASGGGRGRGAELLGSRGYVALNVALGAFLALFGADMALKRFTGLRLLL